MKKTPAEIDKLVSDWIEDPCWELEETEGFEEHEEELKRISGFYRTRWNAEYEERTRRNATRLGIPDNLLLAAYIVRLEERLVKLEEEVKGS